MTQDDLRALYRVESDAKIGARYGVSGALISRRRREWGIQTKGR